MFFEVAGLGEVLIVKTSVLKIMRQTTDTFFYVHASASGDSDLEDAVKFEIINQSHLLF